MRCSFNVTSDSRMGGFCVWSHGVGEFKIYFKKIHPALMDIFKWRNLCLQGELNGLILYSHIISNKKAHNYIIVLDYVFFNQLILLKICHSCHTGLRIRIPFVISMLKVRNYLQENIYPMFQFRSASQTVAQYWTNIVYLVWTVETFQMLQLKWQLQFFSNTRRWINVVPSHKK